VEGVPLLPVDKNNKYSCLDIEAMSEEDEKENICEATPKERVEKWRIKKGRKAAWERRLPRKFMVAQCWVQIPFALKSKSRWWIQCKFMEPIL
jgi:hypothetical protein